LSAESLQTLACPPLVSSDTQQLKPRDSPNHRHGSMHQTDIGDRKPMSACPQPRNPDRFALNCGKSVENTGQFAP